MDEFAERHLKQWLGQAVREEERDSVETDIRNMVREHPELLEEMMCSWPEIRDMAERNRRMLK